MSQERIVWAGGINRSLDPRHIEKHEQYDAYNLEVVQRGALSKRKGFGRWRTSDNTFSDVVRGVALMYDSDGNRYLFVFYDASPGTDLWIEKAGGTPLIITDFFPSSGYRVRWAVFGDRIYFVNGVDRPRWYKEYTGSAHVWGIAGVPSPARRPVDESNDDFYISRAEYENYITSSEGLGIESPGIWRYKQTIGYYGKVSDEQVEESNAGPASRMFHCQFNTAEVLGTQLQGYVEKGIAFGIADFGDLILDAGEAGGQDYEDEIRWMRMYRQWKMFSDELFSPFEFLVEMRKGWPTSINDNYQRDSAMVAPTTRVQIPVSHHIESANNRLFLGRVEKELFTQPGLPDDFRAYNPPSTTYRPNFSYRMPVTIQNTNPKTLTGVAIPLRFQDSSSSDHVATPPSGGGAWAGAYIDTSLTLDGTTTGWYQMMFVDEDGVTPLGFAMLAKAANVVTFLVEIPEIAAGGSRTIYIYFEDSQLATGGDPESYAAEPGDWESIAHYPLCASDHWLLADFENWDSALAIGDVTQKRSLGKIESPAWGASGGGSRQTIIDVFFNKSAWTLADAPVLRVLSSDLTETDAAIKLYPPGDSSTLFSVAFLAKVRVGATAGYARVDLTKDDGTLCARFAFTHNGTTAYLDVTVYDTDGTGYALQQSSALGGGGVGCNDDQIYYFLTIDGAEMKIGYIYGNGTGHPAEVSPWNISGKYVLSATSRSDLAKAIRLDSSGMYFGAKCRGTGGNGQSSWVMFKEMQILGSKIPLVSEWQSPLSYFNRDGHWPDHALATVEDRESVTGEKRPDRMYFSKLNQPNSFEAVDFRDMGELGRPIQGIKGIHNRLFVFDENKIRALFSAGAEQALALVSGDTTMWNLSHDLTGDVGGLGVLAPDSLVTMEFAGRDGVGFLSKRGFYFFDGSGFTHISEKVDNLIYDEAVSDDYRRNLTAHFLGKKRQLILGVLGWYTVADYHYWMLVADMKFAHDVPGMVWSRWSLLIKYGVELDFNIDTGQFVYAQPPSDAHPTKQILKLEGNSGADTYKDISHDEQSGIAVAALAMSKQFDVFDAELLKCDLHTSGDTGYEVDLTVFKDSLISGTPTISNITNGLYRLPIGTNATLFLFQLYDSTAFRCVLERLDFYFNVHGERRLNA